MYRQVCPSCNRRVLSRELFWPLKPLMAARAGFLGKAVIAARAVRAAFATKAARAAIPA